MENYERGIRPMLASALLAALTAVLAFVTIPLPFSPVPVTGQTFGVMLSGALLGAKWGAVSQLVYIALGALGLPVFSGGGSGFGALFGPTGGYLWGFVAGAYITGLIVHRGEYSPRRAVFGLALGSIGVVYLLGLIQLIAVTGLSPVQAVAVAALPFLPGDCLKLVVAAVLVQMLEHNQIYREIRAKAGL